jgi:DNA repair protein RecN (Recombination protein N)
MLKSLSIKNYALIRQLEITPSQQLNIVTGETGAGKSIILGAIGLLIGARADAKSIFDNQEKCIVEATFKVDGYGLEEYFKNADIDYDQHCIIRRELSSNGKSRAFVNDTPTTLEFLKLIGNRLLDIHSQHETMALANPNFQLSILDAFASNFEALGLYQTEFKKYISNKKLLDLKTQEALQLKQQLDYHTFLFLELESANIKSDELEILEQRQLALSNAEEINEKLSLVSQVLTEGQNPVIPSLSMLEKTIAQITKFNHDFLPINQRLKSVVEELKDIESELTNIANHAVPDKAELALVEDRLGTIYALLKKHRVNQVSDLLIVFSQLESKIQSSTILDDDILELQTTIKKQEHKLKDLAEQISTKRKKQIEPICSKIESLLKDLGIPNANVKIAHQTNEIGIYGIDDVNILFSANKGIAPQDLKKSASGGEFSRLMLCIKYLLADKTAMPTIIFDEIDTGISGEIGMQVGKMMRQMGKSHQVIAISHLPQIAAQGQQHYFVYKDHSAEKSISAIKLLTPKEREYEIAKMLSGATPTESALSNAKELLSVC